MDDDLIRRLQSYADDPPPMPDENDLVWTKKEIHMMREVFADMCELMGRAGTALKESS